MILIEFTSVSMAGLDTLQCGAMPTAAPPVRPVTLDEIYAARERIRGVITRTPLIKLRHGTPAPEIWLKLDNLQPINAFKIRGAANAVAMLTPDERAKGVWTISAGNAGQGVAYAAGEYGIPCTVVTIETAPETKIERMRNLGARIVKVPFDVAWRAMDEAKRAMRMVAGKVRVIAEGAGALSVAAALSGKAEGPIVAVISGGNIDLKKFAELVGAA